MNYIYTELPTSSQISLQAKTEIVTVTNKNDIPIEKHLNLNDQNNIYSKISN